MRLSLLSEDRAETEAIVLSKYGDKLKECTSISHAYIREFGLRPATDEQAGQIEFDRYIDLKIPELIKNVGDTVPESAIEWTVKQIAYEGAHWPEDEERIKQAWNTYKNNLGNQQYITVLKDKNPNYKNPLNYTLRNLEDAADAIKPKTSSRQERLASKQGKIYYEDNTWTIIEVTTVEGAISYGQDTRWCTRFPKYAQQYLNDDPLYVIFKNDQKFAQLHVPTGQLKDITDLQITDTQRIPPIELLIVKNPALALSYMLSTNMERFPELEEEINNTIDDDDQFSYKRMIDHARTYSRIVGKHSPEQTEIIMQNIFKRPY